MESSGASGLALIHLESRHGLPSNLKRWSYRVDSTCLLCRSTQSPLYTSYMAVQRP